jgi:RimJ/RimL family protein N-acetyltransferase
VDYSIEICKDMKIETLYAIMLPDNYRAINLMKKMGFTITYLEDGTAKGTLNLREEERCIQREEPRNVGETQIQAQLTKVEQKEPKTEALAE